MKRASTDTLILAASSALGLGYVPAAPGTFGTLAALPLWWLMASLPVGGFAAAAALATVVAVIIAAEAERIYGGHDSQRIVIDEVVGLLCAAIGVPFRLPEVVAAFVLFRLFDIIKPQPVRWIDRHVGGGLGVVLDDAVAGLMACGLLHLARLALGGWW